MNHRFGILNIATWSQIGKNNGTLEEQLDQRPSILLSQFCVFGSLGAFANLVIDLINHSYGAAALDTLITALLLIFYFANEAGRYQFARYGFLISLNAILFLYANFVPKEVGIYLIFFPLIGGTYIFLSRSSRKEKVLMAALPIVILFFLEITNYDVFHAGINLEKGNPRQSFFINLTIATLAFSAAVNYLIMLNQKNEENILRNRDQFKSLAEEIDQKNQTLKKANTELDRFVYSTSHDLRAPLMSILGLINLLKIEESTEVRYRYLDLMQERIYRLDSFIREIIEYTRNDRSEIINEQINLKELVDGVVNNYMFMDETSRIDFKVDIKDNEVIQTDKQRLGVILNNLVGNAIKYHNYSNSDPEIRFQSKREPGQILISVADNGPGIAESDQEKIFEMFYRGSQKSDGSGLGLYIAREISNKLHGKITLSSIPGQGSEFTLVLPEN